MIVDGSVQLGNGTTAQIAAATTVIPLLGQIVLNTQTGQYKIGDGVTALSALSYYGGAVTSGLTVGTTAITSGTNTRILYNNAGVVGEYLVTGTGTTAVLSTSPTFTTDITTPLIIGGTGVGSVIQYKGTSGVGTSSTIAHQFLVGNNGALNSLRLKNDGSVYNLGKASLATNCAFGDGSLIAITSGDYNTGLGYQTLKANTTGLWNSAFGASTLQANIGGSYNTGFGMQALYSNQSGQQNIAIGVNTLFNSTTTNYNVAIGNNALYNANTNYNVAIGYASGYLTTGGYNIQIGAMSVLVGVLTSGTQNTIIGFYDVAHGITTGSYNTLLGSKISGLAAGTSNNVIIADGQGNQVIRKDANHNQIMGLEAALATNATNGFLHVPSCAGVPTGVPTLFTGKIPIVADSTNNRLYIYSGGAWVALN